MAYDALSVTSEWESVIEVWDGVAGRGGKA